MKILQFSPLKGPCGYYGDCSVTNGNFECSCDDHWFGEKCGNYDHCNPNPCLNDGVCIEAGNHFICDCKNEFKGDLCEKSPCEVNPCGTGECHVTLTGYECDCSKDNSYGDQCQAMLKYLRDGTSGSEFFSRDFPTESHL